MTSMPRKHIQLIYIEKLLILITYLIIMALHLVSNHSAVSCLPTWIFHDMHATYTSGVTQILYLDSQ